jgi:hypothetical protein
MSQFVLGMRDRDQKSATSRWTCSADRFVHIPVLIDKKYYGQTGEHSKLDIPEGRVGHRVGGVRIPST